MCGCATTEQWVKNTDSRYSGTESTKAIKDFFEPSDRAWALLLVSDGKNGSPYFSRTPEGRGTWKTRNNKTRNELHWQTWSESSLNLIAIRSTDPVLVVELLTATCLLPLSPLLSSLLLCFPPFFIYQETFNKESRLDLVLSELYEERTR